MNKCHRCGTVYLFGLYANFCNDCGKNYERALNELTHEDLVREFSEVCSWVANGRLPEQRERRWTIS